VLDIAIPALSPAVNDPTTPVHAVGQIEGLLLRPGPRAPDAGCAAYEKGVLRLVFPTPTWEDDVALALDEIRQYGTPPVQVMRRLRSALACLADWVIEAEHRTAVQRYLQHLDSEVERSILNAANQAVALRKSGWARLCREGGADSSGTVTEHRGIWEVPN
jgi:uncharacterized membrane protein